MLLWKHLIALLARVEEEGEKYEEHKVWAPTWIRFERKVLALKEKVDIEVRRSVGRGEKIRNVTRKSEPVEPLAEFTEEGDLILNDDLVKEIKYYARSRQEDAPWERIATKRKSDCRLANDEAEPFSPPPPLPLSPVVSPR